MMQMLKKIWENPNVLNIVNRPLAAPWIYIKLLNAPKLSLVFASGYVNMCAIFYSFYNLKILKNLKIQKQFVLLAVSHYKHMLANILHMPLLHSMQHLQLWFIFGFDFKFFKSGLFLFSFVSDYRIFSTGCTFVMIRVGSFTLNR